MRTWYYRIHGCGKLFHVCVRRDRQHEHRHRKKYKDPMTGRKTAFCPVCQEELFQHTPMKLLHEVAQLRE